MSFTNYGQLKTAIAARLSRSNMTALLPDFISIAHGSMMRGRVDPASGFWIVPPLRTRSMITSTTLTPAGGAVTLPSGFLGVKELTTATVGARPLTYKPPAEFDGMGLASDSGVPEFYTIDDLTSLRIAPANTGVLTLRYYGSITAPSADADTNSIFTVCPEAYLYGALAEAYDHIRQHDRAEDYLRKMGAVVAGANRTADAALVSGAPLVQMPGITV